MPNKEHDLKKGNPIWIDGKKYIISFVGNVGARFSMVAYEEKIREEENKIVGGLI